MRSRLETGLDLDALLASPTCDDSHALVTQCVREAADYFRRAHGNRPAERIAADRLGEALADERALLYVLTERSGEPAGLLELALDTPGPGEVTVVLLVLSQRLRSRGLGTRVSRALFSRLREAGLDHVRLGVAPGESGAAEFWASLGLWHCGVEDGVQLFELALG